MKVRGRRALWLGGAALLCSGLPMHAQIERMEAATVRVVVKLAASNATGSGFVIGNGRYVVTNHHVIKDASEILILSKSLGHKVEGRVVVDSPQKDLAVLEMEGTTGSPVPLVLNAGVHKTETVLAAGFPAAADEQGDSMDNFLEVKFSQGIISGYVKGPNGEALYQISAALNPGNSGGPLFDSCGRVIGVNVEKSLVKAVVMGDNGQQSTERVPLGEGIAWSIQADELVGLLRANNIPVDVQSAACVPGVTPLPQAVNPPSSGNGPGGSPSALVPQNHPQPAHQVAARSRGRHGLLFVMAFLGLCLAGGLIVMILKQS